MNILYITAMKGYKFSGLTTAVPKHIESQSLFDNVFWYNVIELAVPIDNCMVPCHTILEYPNLDINELPYPFNKPDIVIFEDFYYRQFLELAYQIYKMGIPYVIVPHCCFCKLAQNTKYFKKKIANILAFSYFAKFAIAIHYLTVREYLDSGVHWNKKHFIIPNGAEIPLVENKKIPHKNIIGTFIGRLDIHHKGLDLLIQAVSLIKEQLKVNNFVINIYGADTMGDKSKLIDMVKHENLDDLVFIKPAVYDDEKENVLRSTDFFILTSRYEGHPMGLLEALAYGIPVLATYGTNIGEEIKQNDAGWVCNCDSYEIKSQMERILLETNKFEIKGKNAAMLARQYKWSNIAKEAHDQYVKLLQVKILED